MTEGDVLLKTICTYPKDDLARLVYADWLEESGIELNESYAKFIRLSIEITKTHYPSEEYTKLLNEIERLWGSWPDESDLRTMFYGSVPKVNGFEGWCILPYGLHENLDLSLPCAVVKDGFIEAIHVPMSFVICDSCGGRGETRFTDAAGDTDYETCEQCVGFRGLRDSAGNGIGNDNVKALFTYQPISKVHFMRKSPRHVSDSLGQGFTWTRNDTYLGLRPEDDRSEFTVHRAVSNLLNTYYFAKHGRSVIYHRFPESSDAEDFMSDAVIDECRKYSGLI